MKKIILVFIAVAILLISTKVGFTDDLKGYMIPEYYFVGSHFSGGEDVDGIEGQHGFWLRRIYFGYNTKLSDRFSARVRLEMASTAFSEGKLEPFVKNAHLKYKLNSTQSLLVGIIGTPSFDKIEKFWGYRFIEKSTPDFFKLASSRDFGVALNGKSKSGLVYTLMYGNFGSNKGEDNKGKGFYGRLGYENKTMYAEANGHFAADNGKDITYLAGFFGIKGDWGRFGGGYYYRNESPEAGDSKNTSIIGVNFTKKLSKKSEIYARYDHFLKEGLKDPGGYLPIATKGQLPRLLMAGIVFNVHKLVKLSPNIKYVFYGDPTGGTKPAGSDFYFNITAKVAFKTGLK